MKSMLGWQAIEANPDHLEAHYNLGYLYQYQGQASSAIEQVHIVTRLNPNHAEARLNLAVLLASNDQLDEAEREYQKGVKLGTIELLLF